MCRRAMQPANLAGMAQHGGKLPPSQQQSFENERPGRVLPGSCQPPKKPDMVRWFGHARSRVTPRALGWLARVGEGCWRPHPGHV